MYIKFGWNQLNSAWKATNFQIENNKTLNNGICLELLAHKVNMLFLQTLNDSINLQKFY